MLLLYSLVHSIEAWVVSTETPHAFLYKHTKVVEFSCSSVHKDKVNLVDIDWSGESNKDG